MKGDLIIKGVDLEQFAEELTTELLLNAVESRTDVKAAVLYALKEQRKRIGK